MVKQEPKAYVQTVKDLCRVCFTCVRSCPAKAIRIEDGQAEVLAARCIGCGNCVKVCSQGAKQLVDTTDDVYSLLESGQEVVACVAPAFAADYPDVDYRVFVGMLRALGFKRVVEVAFGADLVAERYRRLLSEKGERKYIGTTCPAIVGHVERYHPEIIDNLAPIVSPMIAMARVLRKEHGDSVKVVFIGPCIAKKVEAADANLANEVNAAITFKELNEMFATRGVKPDKVNPCDFDPPHPGLGALFPITRGIFQSAGIKEDLMEGDIIAADGNPEFISAIAEFAKGNLEARLLEVLSCNGCIMGPGMNSKEPLFRRRARVSQYVRFRMSSQLSNHQEDMDRFAGLNLSRSYTPFDQRIPVPVNSKIDAIMSKLGKKNPKDELNCGACGYHTCREHAIAIHKGLAEGEMCLPFVIDNLKTTVHELSLSHARLATTQEQLMQSEKLASMGQLAAGVAHELNNPLGVVLMYSNLLLDETNKSSEIFSDLQMIAKQADRGKKIVANLLDFARENKVLFESTNIEELVRNALESIPIPPKIKVEFQFNHTSPTCELDPDQITQVFTNIIENAFAAMAQGGDLIISTKEIQSKIQIAFSDSGTGIEEENISKVFQPFFTTKKIGKGTGLGLAVSYGIVKMHRGKIDVISNTDKNAGPIGTTFEVELPKRAAVE